MKNKTALQQSVIILSKNIVNRTPDGEVGFSDAADSVSETWDQFEDAGATVNDLERIIAFIRWAKLEGFCQICPMD